MLRVLNFIIYFIIKEKNIILKFNIILKKEKNILIIN